MVQIAAVLTRITQRRGLPERIRCVLAPPGAPCFDGARFWWAEADAAYTDGRGFLLAVAVRRGWGVAYVDDN
jgi:hypothetical protein